MSLMSPTSLGGGSQPKQPEASPTVAWQPPSSGMSYGDDMRAVTLEQPAVTTEVGPSRVTSLRDYLSGTPGETQDLPPSQQTPPTPTFTTSAPATGGNRSLRDLMTGTPGPTSAGPRSSIATQAPISPAQPGQATGPTPLVASRPSAVAQPRSIPASLPRQPNQDLATLNSARSIVGLGSKAVTLDKDLSKIPTVSGPTFAGQNEGVALPFDDPDVPAGRDPFFGKQVGGAVGLASGAGSVAHAFMGEGNEVGRAFEGLSGGITAGLGAADLAGVKLPPGAGALGQVAAGAGAVSSAINLASNWDKMEDHDKALGTASVVAGALAAAGYAIPFAGWVLAAAGIVTQMLTKEGDYVASRSAAGNKMKTAAGDLIDEMMLSNNQAEMDSAIAKFNVGKGNYSVENGFGAYELDTTKINANMLPMMAAKKAEFAGQLTPEQIARTKKPFQERYDKRTQEAIDTYAFVNSEAEKDKGHGMAHEFAHLYGSRIPQATLDARVSGDAGKSRQTKVEAAYAALAKAGVSAADADQMMKSGNALRVPGMPEGSWTTFSEGPASSEPWQAPPAAQPAQPPPLPDRSPGNVGGRQVVTSLYEGVLGRGPDAAGLPAWEKALGEMGPTQIVRGFFGSPEYNVASKSPEQIVTDLYEGVLGRSPDPAGLPAWVAAYNQHGLDVIIQGFVQSPEGKARLGG